MVVELQVRRDHSWRLRYNSRRGTTAFHRALQPDKIDIQNERNKKLQQINIRFSHIPGLQKHTLPTFIWRLDWKKYTFCTSII